MKQYEKYKDSGVEWLGEIPEHWNIIAFKYCLNINNGRDYKHVVAENGYPVFGSGGQFAYASEYIYDGEVIFLGRKGTIDKPLYYCGKFWAVDTIFYAIAKRNVSSRYMYYQALNFPFDLYSTSTALPSMTQTDLNNHIVSLPTNEEQHQIAKYLDHTVDRVDALVKEKENLILKLQEKRKSLINEVVTKGLNPDTPMRDSGIEWLGEIPEHWGITKINRTFELIGSGTTPKSGDEKYYLNGTINWLNTGDLNDGVILCTSKHITKLAFDDFSTLKIYPIGSIVIALYGATIGKLGILDIETTTNQACCVMSNSKEITQKYLFYFLLASKNHIISMSYGGGQPNISQELIRQLPILQFSIEEQTQIVSYIESRTSKIDKITAELKTQIDKLKEYKTSIISEAVTGKIDLRDWTMPKHS